MTAMTELEKLKQAFEYYSQQAHLMASAPDSSMTDILNHLDYLRKEIDILESGKVFTEYKFYKKITVNGLIDGKR